MKRGQTLLIIVFIFLVVVLALSFYFYYFGLSSVNGGAINGRVIELIEKEKITDNLFYPSELEIYAEAGKINSREFSITNYNKFPIKVTCIFPPFQPELPSSWCSSSESESFRVDMYSTTIGPKETKTFKAAVTPIKSMQIKSSSSTVLVYLSKGTYPAKIELIFSKVDEEKTESISIPVKINIQD